VKVAALWADFATYGEKFRPSWKSTQATHWPHLRSFFGELDAEKLTHEQVTDYRALRRTELTPRGNYTTAAARNREVLSLTAMCKWGVKYRRIRVHPLLYLDLEKEIPGRPRDYLSEQGLAAILNNLVQEGYLLDRNIVQTLYDSGLRPGELLALEPRHVRHTGGVPSALALDAGRTKNGKPRTVPLTKRAAIAVAQEMQRGQPFVFGREGWKFPDEQLQDHFRRARIAAGLPESIVPYSCRHACATNLRRRGVDWHLVKEIMGHLSEKAARVYQHVDGEEYRKVVQAMERGISAENTATVVVQTAPDAEVINT
jgi:integrase